MHKRRFFQILLSDKKHEFLWCDNGYLYLKCDRNHYYLPEVVRKDVVSVDGCPEDEDM
jgi:hypothetical protein